MNRISAEQLKQMHQQHEDFLLINTLDEPYFEKTRIAGAINIPQSDDDFVQRVLQQAGDKGKKIITYCASSQCESSKQGAEKLIAAGFTDVADFEAGADGWKAAGERLAVS